MLNYQSTSFHDALYVRELFGLKHAPEFAEWLEKINLINHNGQLTVPKRNHPLLSIRNI